MAPKMSMNKQKILQVSPARVSSDASTKRFLTLILSTIFVTGGSKLPTLPELLSKSSSPGTAAATDIDAQ